MVARKKRNPPSSLISNSEAKAITTVKKTKKKNKSDLTSGSNVDQMTGQRQEEQEKAAESN